MPTTYISTDDFLAVACVVAEDPSCASALLLMGDADVDGEVTS